MKPPLITTKSQFREALQKALPQAREFARALADEPFQKSVLAQLEFMDRTVAEGRTPTYDEREKINIGVIAMRTLEDSFPEYAKLLSELDYAFSRWESLH